MMSNHHLTVHDNASLAWQETLIQILLNGQDVSPRGLQTKEILHHTTAINMNQPVVAVDERKLSYKFMAAEALWILEGDDTVSSIAPYNPKIAEFSDDGMTFFGAYGPRINEQWAHVIDSLLADRDTRQAVLTTWRPNPPKTKDVPCTVSLAFNIRNGALNCHAFMRSSDAWLGVPYDVFNFSMVAARLACTYNRNQLTYATRVNLGTLYLTRMSSHLYAPNWSEAKLCALSPIRHYSKIPSALVIDGDWDTLHRDLVACRDNRPVAAWQIRHG